MLRKWSSFLVIMALMLAGCKGGSSAEKVSDYGADPKKAESIYSYTPTTGVMVDEFRFRLLLISPFHRI